MTVKITPVVQGAHVQTFDVVANRDEDLEAVITHTLGGVPSLVSLTPLADEFHTSRWRVIHADATAVTLAKVPELGSGARGAQVRVNLQRPHSMVA